MVAAAPPSRDASGPATRWCPACGQRYPDDYAVCPRDATPLAREGVPSDDPLIGQVLGDTYEVTRRIGEGGMGRVYEARHVRLGRRFALKVLHAQFAMDAPSVARFRSEATAAAAVQSPNVASVIDVSATRDGRPYIVSELLEGEELGVVLRREDKGLEVGRAVRIARQVARGLAAAHAAGVVHRDLKPENVFIVAGADGRESAKVLDFGIARRMQGDAGLTRTGMVLGTPAYMAPEQARSSEKLDQRVDVYALGAVLYRALTGRPAFAGDDPSSTLTSVLYDEPERPRAIRRDLPEGLELVVQHAMAKDPAARYGSMLELDAALAPFDPDGARGGPGVQPVPSAMLGGAATVAVPAASLIDTGPDAGGTRARRARPRMVAYGLLAFAWTIVLVASLTSALVRAASARPAGALGMVLSLVVAAAVSVPLVVLEVRTLVRGAWRNTASMLARADRFADAVGASFAAYAVIAAGWRALDGVVLGRTAPPAVDVVAAVVALVAGAVVAGLRARSLRR